MMLKLSQVHAGYGAVEVLRDVSLSVAAGEIVGLMGRITSRADGDAPDAR